MRPLLNLRQVADILGVTYLRACELARTGILPGVVRLGRQYRVQPDKLEQFIEQGGRGLPGGWRRQPKEAA